MAAVRELSGDVMREEEVEGRVLVAMRAIFCID
jgi:hypothetical protein